jgi:hypothetical protein
MPETSCTPDQFGGREPKPAGGRTVGMKTPRTLPSLAAALLVTAAACGGTGGSAAPSKAAYITRADAICLKASRAERALPQPGSNTQLAAYVKRVYGLERGVVQDVRALQPPAGDRARITAMLDQVDRALAFESDVEAAAATGNQSSINNAQAKGAKFLNRANVLAARYGFKECGNT